MVVSIKQTYGKSLLQSGQGEGQANGETSQLRYKGGADARTHMYLKTEATNIRDIPPLFGVREATGIMGS